MNQAASNSSSDDINNDEEIQALEAKLEEIRSKRILVRKKRDQIADKRYQIALINTEIEEQANALTHQRNLLRDQLDSLESHLQKEGLLLQKYLQLNPINDAYHIWYSGPFGTINNFRFGRLSTHPIEWTEINSAFGESISALHTIAKKSNYTFKKYILYPMGCFPRLCRVDDPTTLLYLYTDGSYSLFPKRNFNQAMMGFVACISELGNYVMEQDPTLQLPYEIDAVEGKINGHLVTWQSTDEEMWTRAMKYILSDIKWIIAWATKHLQHLN